MRRDVNPNAVAGLYIHFRANVSNLCDQFNHSLHLAFCLLVNQPVVTDRKTCQHNRLVGRTIGRPMQFIRNTRQLLPKLLGQKRHKRMQHSQRLLKNCKYTRRCRNAGSQPASRVLFARIGYMVHTRRQGCLRSDNFVLDELNVPVAEIIPEEMV